MNLVLKDRKLEITPRAMFKEIQEATSLASGSSIEGLVHLVGPGIIHLTGLFDMWCTILI